MSRAGHVRNGTTLHHMTTGAACYFHSLETRTDERPITRRYCRKCARTVCAEDACEARHEEACR